MEAGMIKKSTLYAGFILALLVLAACGSRAATNNVSVGGEKNGQGITIKPSDSLVVRLESNPTTGFRWELAQCDKAVLSPQGEPGYEAAQSGQNLVGGGGWETFQFK